MRKSAIRRPGYLPDSHPNTNHYRCRLRDGRRKQPGQAMVDFHQPPVADYSVTGGGAPLLHLLQQQGRSLKVGDDAIRTHNFPARRTVCEIRKFQ